MSEVVRSDEATLAAERQSREISLDETIAASFPASDPLSTNPNPIGHGVMAVNINGGEDPNRAKIRPAGS